LAVRETLRRSFFEYGASRCGTECSAEYDIGYDWNTMQFLIRVRASRLTTFLAMLRLVGYVTKVTRKEDKGDGATEILMEISGSDDVARVLLAWLRTIPEVETVTII
jgi:hypothetical protein